MIERELKVSDLAPGMAVRLWKSGRPTAEALVLTIDPQIVAFQIEGCDVYFGFLAARTGPDLENITDDSGIRMRIFAL